MAPPPPYRFEDSWHWSETNKAWFWNCAQCKAWFADKMPCDCPLSNNASKSSGKGTNKCKQKGPKDRRSASPKPPVTAPASPVEDIRDPRFLHVTIPTPPDEEEQRRALHQSPGMQVEGQQPPGAVSRAASPHPAVPEHVPNLGNVSPGISSSSRSRSPSPGREIEEDEEMEDLYFKDEITQFRKG